MAENFGSQPWFHSNLSMSQAEYLLRENGMKDGLFLIRDDRDGELVLSIAFKVLCSSLLLFCIETFDAIGVISDHPHRVKLRIFQLKKMRGMYFPLVARLYLALAPWRVSSRACKENLAKILSQARTWCVSLL
jgi:hypothetical protein